MTATLRRIQSDDLKQIVRFPFTVWIRDPADCLLCARNRKDWREEATSLMGLAVGSV